jgi:6-phospho-beta-glucosidase
MVSSLKVTVIGGGSTYAPELVNGFIERASSFPLTELWLMDIDSHRLEIVGGFAQRLVQVKGNPFKLILSTDRRAALKGASYVITQLRVGMNPARREDEYLGRRHGLIGQETTGIGGMAKALRTIPVILDIARDMKQVAPGALLANFTNPAGLVTEALTRYAPDVPAVGVCNAAITTQMHLLDELEKILDKSSDLKSDIEDLPHVHTFTRSNAVLNTLGLNHLTWHRGLTVEGQEYWPQIMHALIKRLETEPDAEWDVNTIKTLGMLPNYYLHYYYYTDRVLAEQQKWPPSRAEQVMEIEKDLLRLYADPKLQEVPAELMKRGGAYYSTLATRLLDSHRNNLGQVHVVNVPNHGAVSSWPNDWVIELPCQVDASGIHPLPTEPLPPVCFGLVAQVKMYELLTVEAAVKGDRKALYEALLCHPLGPQADRVQIVMNDLLQTNHAFLPQFG